MLTDTSTWDTLAGLMREITDRVRKAGAPVFESGASVPEALYIHGLVERFGLEDVAEIGFNLGYSAYAFLEGSADLQLVSFELNDRECVRLARDLVNERWPGRHEIVFGSSLETLPRYAEQSDRRFDLLFVDGGHEYDMARADIRNARTLAKPGALVLVDDMTPWMPWGIGPYRAWMDAVADGEIEPIEYFVDGFPLPEIQGPGDRAWGLGRFTV